MGKSKYKAAITVGLIVLLLCFGVIALKNNMFTRESGLTQSENLQKIGHSEAASKSLDKQMENIKSGTIQVDATKIVSADEAVEIENSFGKKQSSGNVDEKYRVQVTDYYYSRRLEAEFTASANVQKHYNAEKFQEDGEIIKDYQYLYVDVDVTNISDVAVPFAATRVSYIEANKEGTIVYTGESANRCFEYIQSDSEAIMHGGLLQQFQVGSTLHMKFVYVVPDEVIDRNDICIYLSNGISGREGLEKKGVRFIALDVADKQH